MAARQSNDRDELTALVADLGLRRLQRVQITVTSGPVIAEVIGVSRRYPRAMRVSLHTANRLVAAGAPVYMTHAR